VPILSGLVPSRPYLFVATWDGTVRAMLTRGNVPPPPPAACSVGGVGAVVPAALVILVLGLWRRRVRQKYA
jgi:uncharacterized protein (TIGR03382 family)